MIKDSKAGDFSKQHFVLPEVIGEGQRNYMLTRAGGVLRRVGCDKGVIFVALKSINEERCQPPLPEKEIWDIAKSVARYAPDPLMVAIVEGHYQQMVDQGFDLLKFMPSKKAEQRAENVKEVPFDEWDYVVVNFDQIMDYPQEWLWENRIPKGTVTILEGPPKVGKTTAMVDWISRLTNGYPLPFTDNGVDPEPVKCMILAPEDPVEQVLKPRLSVAGAAKHRVFYMKGFESPVTQNYVTFSICQSHLDKLQDLVIDERIGLVYIDAVMGILPGKTDEKSDKEVRQNILDPLVRVAEEANCAIVIGRHWAKGASMRLSLEKGLGSIGWSARARSVLQVAKDPDDPKTRIFCVAASNGPETSALKFKIEGAEHTFPNGKTQVFGRAEWVAEIQDFDPDSFGKAPDDPKASEKAIEWLLEYLGKNGVTLAKSVDEAARQAKIGHKALKDAKAQLKKDGRIDYDKRLDGWWVIPTGSTGSTGTTGAADPVD